MESLGLYFSLCPTIRALGLNELKLKIDMNYFFPTSLRHRRTLNLFVAFPWVETSTGPGGFMICVFII